MRRSSRLLPLLAMTLAGLALSPLVFSSLARSADGEGGASPENCRKILVPEAALAPAGNETRLLRELALEFAAKHRMPTQELELGPEGRRVKRLFVGLDYWNWGAYLDFLWTFNLENAPDSYKRKGLSGVLDITASFEPVSTEEQYVSVELRPRADPSANVWSFGREDIPRDQWWNVNFLSPANRPRPINGFSHLIGLNEADKLNVWKYLYNRELRAPSKVDNCVAWIPGIELGRTDRDVPPEQRRFLFSELGVSRSVAHFEIARRLMHAANDRHQVVFVYLNGPEGRKAFENDLRSYLPPEPKLPYHQIIKGLDEPLPDDLKSAMSLIPDGGRVFMPIAAGASPDGLRGLSARANELPKGATLVTLVNGLGEGALARAAEGKLKLEALFLGSNMRSLHSQGKVALREGSLYDFSLRIRDAALDPASPYRYDAIVVRVSPPDAEGRYSLGPNDDLTMSLIRTQPWLKIIAEVNPLVPFTRGENWLRRDQIHAFFSSRAALAGPPVVPEGEVEATIASRLAGLVESGSTLQVGIGNLFVGLGDAFKKAAVHDLRIHTEMMSDPLMRLIQDGVATDATATFLYGSQALYDWAAHNPKLTLAETEFVHDPARLARIPRLVAMNTALQVDLAGNANATYGPGGSRVSSPGGQPDFMEGAKRSQGGKAIIAIRSTAKSGTISSISLDLYGGVAEATTPGDNVTHIVTEFGVAELVGKNASERALAILRISHPKFRWELVTEAVRRGIISSGQAASFK